MCKVFQCDPMAISQSMVHGAAFAFVNALNRKSCSSLLFVDDTAYYSKSL